jgi:hypothetical protein
MKLVAVLAHTFSPSTGEVSMVYRLNALKMLAGSLLLLCWSVSLVLPVSKAWALDQWQLEQLQRQRQQQQLWEQQQQRFRQQQQNQGSQSLYDRQLEARRLREQQLQQQQLARQQQLQQQQYQQQQVRLRQCQMQCSNSYNSCMASALYVNPRTGQPDPFAGMECPSQKSMCELSCR